MANSTYSELIRFYGVLEDKKGIFWMIGNNWIPVTRSGESCRAVGPQIFAVRKLLRKMCVFLGKERRFFEDFVFRRIS